MSKRGKTAESAHTSCETSHGLCRKCIHLGKCFVLRLPAEDAPCRGYSEIMVQVFEDAGAAVSCEG